MKRNAFFIFIVLFLIAGLTARAESDQPERILLWFDATANFERFSTADSVCFYLDKCKEVGITDAVVDVRPISGDVLWQSKIAPELVEWNGFDKVQSPTDTGKVKYVERPNAFKRDRSFDMLRTFINEAHKREMKVHAALNMFVGGHNFVDRGIVYTEHPDWQSINYTPNGMQGITSQKQKYSAMMNPNNPEVRRYLISLLKEVCEKYPDLDGIILDRGRFDGMEADFSETSKLEFEKYIGEKLAHFPQDIYEWVGNDKPKMKNGPYFRKWLEFRSGVIRDFFYAAREAVKSVNPEISFGDYTGAWYSSYYDVGVNWGSCTYDPSAEYDWATPGYGKTGYAKALDLLTVGCYFPEVYRSDVNTLNQGNVQRLEAGMRSESDPENTVEGSADLALRVTKGVVPVYGGLLTEQYIQYPQQFVRACRLLRSKTNGLMIFDISDIIQQKWWVYLKEGIKNKI